jgi:hypothetical protein
LTRTIGATHVLGKATVVSIEASPSLERGDVPVIAAAVVFESAPQKNVATTPANNRVGEVPGDPRSRPP